MFTPLGAAFTLSGVLDSQSLGSLSLSGRLTQIAPPGGASWVVPVQVRGLRPPRLAGALIHVRLSPFRQRTVERRGVSGDLGVGLWQRVRLGATAIHTQVGGCFRWR